MIPRILHQVWVGPDPFPDRFAEYRKTWRTHHPDWELRFWTDENLPPDLRLPASYERLRSPVERCDLLRLELVWRDGGVYVDCDFECRRPLDPLLEGIDFLLGYSKPGRVNHALLGAAPHHPVLDRALGEVRPRDAYGYDKDATGPGFFNRVIAEYDDLNILEPELFYPRTPDERRRAYAVHHEARSWKGEASLRDDLARAERVRANVLDELALLRRAHETTVAELDALRSGKGLTAFSYRLNRLALPRRTAARLRRRLRRLRVAP